MKSEIMSDLHITQFLRGLRRDSGAFADAADGEGALRPTLSVLKVLEIFGALADESRTVEFIRRCRTDAGGFAASPGATPTPLDTAAGLIALKTLGQDALLLKRRPERSPFSRRTRRRASIISC